MSETRRCAMEKCIREASKTLSVTVGAGRKKATYPLDLYVCVEHFEQLREPNFEWVSVGYTGELQCPDPFADAKVAEYSKVFETY